MRDGPAAVPAASIVRTAMLAASIAAVSVMATSPSLRAEPITVEARAVPLDAAQPERSRVGSLEYMGGVQLSSADPRFGGWSALLVSADGGGFTAVSDEGWLLTGRLVEVGGWLEGVADCDLRALRAPGGGLLGGGDKAEADAESLARDGDGLLVGFERDDRILRYPTPVGVPVPFDAPEGLRSAPDNAGLETLTRLPDGHLFALTEGLETAEGVGGWVGAPGAWQPLSWITSEGFRPTDAAAIPGGDVLVLERRFPPPGARVRRTPAAAIVPGAVLDGRQIARFEGSLTTDNMEGIATRPGADGAVLTYLLSDDNYSALQRTLLLKFRLVD